MKQAFSLVELSIVLVILGLLVGGILGGKSLIHAAELRAVISEEQKYVAAIQTFKGKYFALPGDMNNATQFWGAVAAGPGLCWSTMGTGTQTCNGDGNGTINQYDSGFNSLEYMRFWQHLANAQLIEGTFEGITTAPLSRYPNGNWQILFPGEVVGGTRFQDDYTNALFFARILLPEDMWNIDSKLDDGKPGTGKVTTGTDCTSAASATDFAATYLLVWTGSGPYTCPLYFRQQF